MTASQHLLLKQPQSLSLTPNRPNTIATLHTTVGTLEANFTQFKMSISNEIQIQRLKDKQVHQDNHLKLHKQISDGICSDLSLHIDNVNGEFTKQAKQLKKLQEDNQALHKKKYSLIFGAHTNLSAQYEQLQAEVTFLKHQIKALWQKPAEDTNVTQMPLPSTKEPTQTPSNSSADDEDAQSSSPRKDHQRPLSLVEMPTENRFSALDDSHQEPSVSTSRANPLIVNIEPPFPTNLPITEAPDDGFLLNKLKSLF